jgi:uncharacterized protein
MKYLLVIAVLAIAYFLWRQSRIGGRGKGEAPPRSPDGQPQDMVRCPVCAVHLPRADAVAGAGGTLYCSQEHRLQGGA